MAAHEVHERRRSRRPQPERPVDVHPRVHPVGRVDDRGKIVEGARVHLAGLCADDRRHVALERVRQRGDVHPPLPVGRHDDLLRAADAEKPKRPRDGHVALSAHDDSEGRGAREPALGEIPPRAPVHAVPGGGEAGDVRHLAAGDERERGVAWEPE